MLHLACSEVWLFSVNDDWLIDVDHPIISPKIIIVRGRIFIEYGINVIVDDIGFIHVSIDPVITAISASRSIGLIILDSSVIRIIGDELDEDHIVTTLNRIE